MHMGANENELTLVHILLVEDIILKCNNRILSNWGVKG
jgi:hypothetical protein